ATGGGVPCNWIAFSDALGLHSRRLDPSLHQVRSSSCRTMSGKVQIEEVITYAVGVTFDQDGVMRVVRQIARQLIKSTASSWTQLCARRLEQQVARTREQLG